MPEETSPAADCDRHGVQMTARQTSLTVDEWAAEEIERVRAFVVSWKRSMLSEPQHFPATLPPGEWDEQYRSATDA